MSPEPRCPDYSKIVPTLVNGPMIEHALEGAYGDGWAHRDHDARAALSAQPPAREAETVAWMVWNVTDNEPASWETYKHEKYALRAADDMTLERGFYCEPRALTMLAAAPARRAGEAKGGGDVPSR